VAERIDVGRVGVWSGAVRGDELEAACRAAAELEQLGYGAIWMPGRGGDVFERAEALLEATSRIVIATGIVSIWSKPAGEVAEAHLRLETAHPGRFLLGLGVSHGPRVAEYRTPLRAMRRYLDELDAVPGAPPRERILAALAPRMLELARERSAGSHTYLVTPDHTRAARSALGAEALLAPELGVVLERDPDRARAIARRHLEPYTQLPNYVRNWLRSGFTEDDVSGGGSDRLVDALVAWGDAEAVAARVEEHYAAGADHVAIQVLPATMAESEQGWKALAPLLAG
jgi:probable F420-dependent oxidoreductase